MKFRIKKIKITFWVIFLCMGIFFFYFIGKRIEITRSKNFFSFMLNPKPEYIILNYKLNSLSEQKRIEAYFQMSVYGNIDYDFLTKRYYLEKHKYIKKIIIDIIKNKGTKISEDVLNQIYKNENDEEMIKYIKSDSNNQNILNTRIVL